MKKFIYFAIPVLVSAFFVLIMLSGSIIKKSVKGTNQDFVAHVDIVIENVANDKWEEADENTHNLKETWKKISKKIQFSVERDEMNQLEASIARLEGAIFAKDRSSALIQLFEAKLHWQNIGR